MNEPMEVHMRDCVDSIPNGHQPNGYNRSCLCPCHAKYRVLEGQVHRYLKHIPAHNEWITVDKS